MKYAFVCLGAVLVCGCGAGNMFSTGVSGNESYVSISNVWNEAYALPHAEKHCAQYGKIPKFQSKQDYAVVFDCVPSNSQ